MPEPEDEERNLKKNISLRKAISSKRAPNFTLIDPNEMTSGQQDRNFLLNDDSISEVVSLTVQECKVIFVRSKNK